MSAMSKRERALSRGRPIFIATYQETFSDDPEEALEQPAAAAEETEAPRERHVPMRQQFPAAGSDYNAGECDGYEYRTVFAGSTLEHTFRMVCEFLGEEGYGDVIVPRDAAELECFRIPARNGQIVLFDDNGYVHNPIKILFPADRRRKTQLILCIYNEKEPDHLLRFHRRLERRKTVDGQGAAGRTGGRRKVNGMTASIFDGEELPDG